MLWVAAPKTHPVGTIHPQEGKGVFWLSGVSENRPPGATAVAGRSLPSASAWGLSQQHRERSADPAPLEELERA